ncbi:hypothetical protein OIDMADRAFT_55319 [Oidiodendron maius Zn]|uniref:G domain-containing protein n=1 Tax=Oidiodendron maius (strain Zn) TaxID=913774 RepID=A0A0C3GXG8_OIDMZ|nr:hypothetical protein OIDMADRAFT_55319 [Oidiodendron maius Zn]
MSSIVAKIVSSVFGAPRHTKIAILGLDGAGGLDLLKRVCDTAIEQHTDKTRATAYTGTNHTLKFDFVVAEVGGNATAEYHRWTAQQFCDADAFIWVVDSTDTDRLMESQWEMKICRQGRRLMYGLVQPAVRSEAPWLVLIDFKRNPLSIAHATEQAELVTVDGRHDLDWTFRAVSITTAEGLEEAMIWLHKKLKRRGLREIGQDPFAGRLKKFRLRDASFAK